MLYTKTQLMQHFIDLIKAFFIGIKEGLNDLVDWKRPARAKPGSHQEDTSWKKFFIYPEWRLWSVTEVTSQITVVLILLILIREGIGEFRYIPSESMEPTLVKGDKLFVEKISKRFVRDYKRGDIVIFYPPPAAKDGEEILHYDPFSIFARLTGLPFLPQPEAFIKRIVGVPGDKIQVIKNQGIFINKEHLDEPYHYNSIDFLPEYETEEVEIPKGYFYVLGDNRNFSYDSHYWGLLPKERIIGRAAFLIYRGLGEKPKIVPALIDPSLKP